MCMMRQKGAQWEKNTIISLEAIQAYVLYLCDIKTALKNVDLAFSIFY